MNSLKITKIAIAALDTKDKIGEYNPPPNQCDQIG